MKNLIKKNIPIIFGLSSLFCLSATASSIYTLVDIEDATTYTGQTVIVYEENDAGEFVAVTKGVSISNIASDDTRAVVATYYSTWDADNNKYVLSTTEPTDGTEYFTVSATTTTANTASSNQVYAGITASSNATTAFYVNNSGWNTNLYNAYYTAFVGNSNTGGTGGASFLQKTAWGTLDADFIGNYSTQYGGGIRLGGTVSTEFTGDFIGNYVDSTAAASAGGAIYFTGLVTELKKFAGDFIGNYISSTGATSAQGGAIFINASSITAIESDFIGNYISASSAASVQGGAIYNSAGTVASLTGDFIGNYISASSSATAQGAAIYNTGTITFTGDMQFTGNYITTDGGTTKTYEAIYNTNILNFAAGEGATITVNDGINGSGGTMNITSGTTVLNNFVTGQSLSVSDGAVLELGSVTLDGTAFSADLSESSLNIASGGTLSLAVSSTTSALNSISIGTLTLDSSAIVALDLSEVFGEFSLSVSYSNALYNYFDTDLDEYVLSIIFENSDIEYTLSADADSLSSYDYIVADGEEILAAFTTSSDGSTITITGISNVAVPEPSTYAMILGAITLGFAYYRRRK